MVAKFLSKYILEVIPSIVATVIGAYIVTHYINAKSEADKPKAEVAAPAHTAKDAKSAEPAKAVEAPAPKVAKTEPAKTESAKAESAKADPEPATETSAPAEPRRRPVFREKAAAKPVVTPPVEAKAEDTRDANEIAREAIARLRNSDQAQPVEAPRAQDRARVNVTYAPPSAPQAPIQAPPAIQTPPVNAVPPLNEVTVAPAPQPPVVRADESFRPSPPADIPSRPLDLRAKERTSVAEDVVSTAKSVFHAVIPGTN